jgi:hypothetical protein
MSETRERFLAMRRRFQRRILEVLVFRIARGVRPGMVNAARCGAGVAATIDSGSPPLPVRQISEAASLPGS